MKSFLLIGLGRFGSHIAINLYEMHNQVMAIDIDENKINAILPYVTKAQIGDCTNEDYVRSLGVKNYDVCIVSVGDDFEHSLLITCLLKEFGARLIVSRASSDIHAKLLLRNGADHVVYPERQLAKWTATCYSSEKVFDYIELDSDHAIYEVSIPEEWIGKKIIDLNVRKTYNINILGIKKGSKTNISIGPDTVVEKDCNMIVLGSHKAVQKCFRIE